MPFFGVILVCIFPHSDWIRRNTPGMPENADQNNSEYLHFSRSYRIYAGQTAPPSSDIIDRAWYKSFMRKSMKSVQRWWTLLDIGQWMLQPQVHFNKNLPLSTGYIFIHYSFLWIWSHLMKKSFNNKHHFLCCEQGSLFNPSPRFGKWSSSFWVIQSFVKLKL